MSRNYDNWERLVAAVLRKEQLWQLFHEDSRSPSLRSEDSSSSSSSFRYLDSPLHDLPSFSASFTYKVQPKLVFVSDSSPVFVFDDLLGASAKLLGHGTFGSTYSAAMDNGIIVVVKELNMLSMSEVEFKRHMELVQHIRHKNVVELRGYFYSKDEKLMLYDHYSNGSVSMLLHGRIGENRANVNWETRKRIALGVARGIAYIHTQCGAKLVHGNIKASNVFLDSQQYGCVSDFGLTNMIPITFLNTAQYHTPEVKNSFSVSQSSDVYNFGILLLELLTRVSSNQDFDIVMWVNSVKRKEWTTKVFDVDVFKNPALEDQMVKMLQIGIRCVARAPKKRPKMSAILKIIEDISTMKTKNYISTTVNQNNTLVFFYDLDRGFDLEELFGSSAEILGKGTFGTSYKVVLDNEISFVVKRMKVSNLLLKEFQQYIELIGKLRHDNVSKLKAYFYSKDEQLLVKMDSLFVGVFSFFHSVPLEHKMHFKEVVSHNKVKMNRYYDNWEKLVEAVMKREQIRARSLDSSRSPSTRSMDSDFSLSSSSHYDSEYLSSRPTPTPSPLHPETIKHKLVEIVGKGKQTRKAPTKRRNMWKDLSIFKENGKEERESNWTSDRRTLHGPELFREEYSFKEISQIAEEAKRRADIARRPTWNQLKSHQLSREKGRFKEVSQITEEAKRRAEIARLQEMHTLKGHIESIIKAKGLDVEPVNHYYTV